MSTATQNTAVEQTLNAAKAQMGFVPALLNDFANLCPSAFLNYMQGASTLAQNSTLTKQEQIATMMFISALNNCDYCVAAHKAQAKGAAMDAADVAELAAGQNTTSGNYANLTNFAKTLWETRGNLTQEQKTTFANAGMTKSQQLEVVALYSLKVITNYGHHITESAIDAQFQG